MLDESIFILPVGMEHQCSGKKGSIPFMSVILKSFLLPESCHTTLTIKNRTFILRSYSYCIKKLNWFTDRHVILTDTGNKKWPTRLLRNWASWEQKTFSRRAKISVCILKVISVRGRMKPTQMLVQCLAPESILGQWI